MVFCDNFMSTETFTFRNHKVVSVALPGLSISFFYRRQNNSILHWRVIVM